MREHFGMNNGMADIGKLQGKRFNLPRITISNGGGVYQLAGDRKFEKDLLKSTQIGTGKDGLPHISPT